MNHTPTPWKISKPKSKRSPVSILTGDADIDSTGRLVRGRIIATGVGKADADFIVRACNAHEKSIETLKELETDCLHLMQAAGVPNEKITKPYANSMLGRIQAALKLARGE